MCYKTSWNGWKSYINQTKNIVAIFSFQHTQMKKLVWFVMFLKNKSLLKRTMFAVKCCRMFQRLKGLNIEHRAWEVSSPFLNTKSFLNWINDSSSETQFSSAIRVVLYITNFPLMSSRKKDNLGLQNHLLFFKFSLYLARPVLCTQSFNYLQNSGLD